MAKPKFPSGIPYIIGNEAAERFSFYGMRSILQVFMTVHLVNSLGQPDQMSEEEASIWYHSFTMGVYLFPLLGALLSDIFWGKYKTIIVLSIVYCLGHFALAIDTTRTGLLIGLSLICFGAGGIKPCVSAHVGDQFTEKNKSLIEPIFGLFYIAINVGSAIATIIIPNLLDSKGPHWAFGLPGVLMVIATLFFYIGRKKFISIPPIGWKKYKNEILVKDHLLALGNLLIIFFFISIFWSLFDQQGSTWVTQMKSMDRSLNLFGYRFEILPSQLQTLNPVFIILLVPFFSFVVYPRINIKPLYKVTIGFIIAACSFLVIAYAQSIIDNGKTPSFLWQALAYFLISIAEVMVSVTILEFSYTQAPKVVKSLVMALYMLSIFVGNFIAMFTIMMIELNEEVKTWLSGKNYFLFFVALILITATIFGFYSRGYKEKSYVNPA